ncbi:MAG: cyclic nucleotide-binding domain-containing protein [Chloroflexi bacterium]|nr:cyclic nucleotide-binding domain-containing protein [Chloroflexota bacterium]
MTSNRTPAKIIPRAFPGIRPEEVEQIISNSRVISFSAETIVCRENALETSFYMILEGDFEVTKVINNTETRLLKTLTAGDFFGEMALIHNAPRAATVTAKTPAVVLELDKDGFSRVLKTSPSMAMAMVSEISNRLRQNDQMAIEDLRLRAAELAEAYRKLAEQELARREFLTNVAHELRTPLMVAGGYLHALEKGMVPADQMESIITTIKRNVDQITSLTNDILFLQEIELVIPEFQPVDMVGIAEAVIEKYQAKADARRIKMKLIHEKNLPQIHGDPQSLERAVIALLDNAIKFSKPGGEVEIQVREKDGRLILAVNDHGIGIDPQIRSRIFDRFFHLERHGDELYGGLGIGLSITRQVIQQHHGTLEVQSVPEKGSIFTISLPFWN